MDLEVKLARARQLFAAASRDWPASLLSSEELSRKAREFGWHFDAEDIEGLWRAGILRADVSTCAGIPSDTRFQPVGLADEEGSGIFWDGGRAPNRVQGYGSGIAAFPAYTPAVRAWFHPFRLFVLHHVRRTLTIKTTPTQYAKYVEGVQSVSVAQVEHLDHWTATDQFSERFDYWNRVAELAIVCEPLVHETHFRPGILLPGRREQLQGAVRELLIQMGEQHVNEQRGDLAFAADTLDQNRTIHTLLRLMKSSERLHLKDSLGAAMHLLNMAEVIRRSHEYLLGTELPEEDELGPGQWMEGARRRLYGHDRVFDAPKRNLREFLNILGLDFGVKVACYVEGETELGALAHASGVEAQVKFVNLRGQFAEKGGRGLSFVESLESDKASHVFSLIVLDGDRSDFVRAVRRAAADRKFFGRFWISSPDFEFANFTLDELTEIVARLQRGKAEVMTYERQTIEPSLRQVLFGCTSADKFFDALKKHGVSGVGKGETWGRALMAYAIEHPHFAEGHIQAGVERPIIDMAKLLVRAQGAGFLGSMEQSVVDPDTGRLTPIKQ
jgi:hypothetical protein